MAPYYHPFANETYTLYRLGVVTDTNVQHSGVAALVFRLRDIDRQSFSMN